MRRHNAGFLCILCGLAVSCVPWTVVPIEEEQTTASAAGDAQAYVDSIWGSRLLPAAREHAVDLATAKARHERGSGSHFFVAGTGRVVSLDESSRSGKLLIDLDPGDGQPDAALLVGPVILGSAVRDAAGFIEFSQFVNQLAYADVANELNRRVLDTVLAPIDLKTLPGKTVRFCGAWSPAGEALSEIVPLVLEVE